MFDRTAQDHGRFSSKMSVAALLVAAGRGTRASGGADATPKQYRVITGAPVLAHTLTAFMDHDQVDQILVVIHPDDQARFDAIADMFANTVITSVHGGTSRQDSVYFGLRALQSTSPEFVLIHDAARPFVDREVITRVINALGTHDAALPVMPVADTLKRGRDALVEETVDRSTLYAAQTPQGFRFPMILQAHEAARGVPHQTFTDDASIAEWHRIPVALTQGSSRNIKLTTAEDIEIAEKIMSKPSFASQEYRTGIGYDTHCFVLGDHVILCGVSVPHSKGLHGHSDADVGLHALTDAVLGAVGEGDIGTHFPPSDDRWRGAASEVFLREAANRVRALDGDITHVDITLICEEPKIGPYREAMRERIAEILQIHTTRVSVKATTTEGLGFTGRKEGIAAQAVATVSLPAE